MKPHRIPFPVSPTEARHLAAGLLGLIDAEGGPTAEQERVFSAVASHLLALEDSELQGLEPLAPGALAAVLPEPWRSIRLSSRSSGILPIVRRLRRRHALFALTTHTSPSSPNGKPRRRGLARPNRETPNPRYDVCHDMNHVITGYEPTGPGEIALGAFKLALNNSDANWMASLTNFLIHEVGLFKHGTNHQFVAYGGGGEPYHGLNGRLGALDLPGFTDLFAEALVRGSSCRGDFSQVDHLAIASEPLREIRRRFHVLPLHEPMINQPDLWPELA